VNNIHHSVLCKVYKLEGYSGQWPVYHSMRDLGNASEEEDEGDEDNVIADISHYSIWCIIFMKPLFAQNTV
ncbi:hypothetical protein HYDPIDRAFT_102969, partial [Hydnomerulius pinastri MD-312]